MPAGAAGLVVGRRIVAAASPGATIVHLDRRTRVAGDYASAAVHVECFIKLAQPVPSSARWHSSFCG